MRLQGHGKVVMPFTPNATRANPLRRLPAPAYERNRPRRVNA